MKRETNLRTVCIKFRHSWYVADIDKCASLFGIVRQQIPQTEPNQGYWTVEISNLPLELAQRFADAIWSLNCIEETPTVVKQYSDDEEPVEKIYGEYFQE